MRIEGIKNILIGIFPQAGDGEARGPSSLGAAAGLARAAGAELITARTYATHLRTPFSIAPGFSASFVASENKASASRAEAALLSAREGLSGAARKLDAGMQQMQFEQLLQTFVMASRLHDLTIVEADPSPLALARSATEEALFNAGRPILVLPQDRGGFQLRRAVIAWDGSARAARALHDAMPLLRAAEEVEILCVEEEKKTTKSAILGADLAPFLVHHGLKVTVTNVAAKGGDIGATIADHAVLIDADLIVMGGYGHSRWREFVLGGVTASMLEKPPLPVLMAY